MPAPSTGAQGDYGPRPIEHILAYGYRLDIGAVLSEGWRLFTLDIGGFIGFAFVGGVIAVLLALTIVGFLLYLPLLAGLWIVPLLMLKGRPHGFNDFFGGFKQLGQLVLLGLVMGLLVILGIIAFIIPGVYLGIAWTWALRSGARPGHGVLGGHVALRKVFEAVDQSVLPLGEGAAE